MPARVLTIVRNTALLGLAETSQRRRFMNDLSAAEQQELNMKACKERG